MWTIRDGAIERVVMYRAAGGPRSRGAVGARRSRRLLSLRDTARAMSQENVEIVRRLDAFNGGDIDRLTRYDRTPTACDVLTAQLVRGHRSGTSDLGALDSDIRPSSTRCGAVRACTRGRASHGRATGKERVSMTVVQFDVFAPS